MKLSLIKKKNGYNGFIQQILSVSQVNTNEGNETSTVRYGLTINTVKSTDGSIDVLLYYVFNECLLLHLLCLFYYVIYKRCRSVGKCKRKRMEFKFFRFTVAVNSAVVVPITECRRTQKDGVIYEKLRQPFSSIRRHSSGQSRRPCLTAAD